MHVDAPGKITARRLPTKGYINYSRYALKFISQAVKREKFHTSMFKFGLGRTYIEYGTKCTHL